MDEAKRAAAARTVGSVLEQFAFLFADAPVPGGAAAAEAIAASPEGFLASSITFAGPEKGGMLVAVPLPLARELAANLLGTDPDDPKAAEHAPDSLGELLNVACGHVLSALHGSAPTFDLSAPRAFPLESGEAAALARKDGSLVFDVDGATLIFHASFCGDRAPAPGDHA